MATAAGTAGERVDGVRSVSDVPVGDIPCYPKHEAVIPQHLTYVSAERWPEERSRTIERRWTGTVGAGSRSPDYYGDINHLRITGRVRRDLSEFAINSKLPSSSHREGERAPICSPRPLQRGRAYDRR